MTYFVEYRIDQKLSIDEKSDNWPDSLLLYVWTAINEGTASLYGFYDQNTINRNLAQNYVQNNTIVIYIELEISDPIDRLSIEDLKRFLLTSFIKKNVILESLFYLNHQHRGPIINLYVKSKFEKHQNILKYIL